MILLQVFLVVAVAGAALAVFVLQRAGKLSQQVLTILAFTAALALAAMIITDWPTSVASGFWSDHAVLVDTLSAVLLGGTVYLAFEARETHRQEEIGASLAATAYGGVVDHMVDLDLALAYMVSDTPPPVPSWLVPQKPLRWMREPVVQHDRVDVDGVRRARPSVDIGEKLTDEQRARAQALIDQSLRRLMAAMRDWAPLFTAGRDGRAVLVRLGHLRSAFLLLESRLEHPAARSLWEQLRLECHSLALGLEVASGSPRLRPEVFCRLPVAVDGSAEFAAYRDVAQELDRKGLDRDDLAKVRRKLGHSDSLPDRTHDL